MSNQISVKVIAGARQNQVVGWEGDILKVKVTAPPEKGEANEAVIDLLSTFFKIPKSKIVLLRGHKSRNKIFIISPPHQIPAGAIGRLG